MSKTAFGKLRLGLLLGVASAALLTLPQFVSSIAGHAGMDGQAFAQAQGQGGGSGRGQGGPGAGRGGPGGGTAVGGSGSGGGRGGAVVPGGSGGGPRDSASGRPSDVGGSGGSTTSGSKLGRLNMGRAFISPGFDITKVDDPEAPIAQVYTYLVLVETPLPADDPTTPEVNEREAAILAAGTALGNAATVIPITYDTVVRLNTTLGATTTWDVAALTEVAAIATTVVESRRTEEEPAATN